MVVSLGVSIAFILSGPIELGAVRNRIVALVSQTVGPQYDVTVGRATVDVDPVLGLVVAIDELSVRDEDDDVVGSVPAIRVAINPLSLFLARLDVRTVEIDKPEISLVRGRSGQVFLGTADTPEPPGSVRAEPAEPGRFPDLVEALGIVDSGLQPGIEAATRMGFERLALSGATINVWDAKALQQRTFAHSDLAITVDPESAGLHVAFTTSGYSGRWTVTGDRIKDPKTGARTYSTLFSQLTVADLDPDLGRATSPFRSDVPLFGRASLRIGAGGAIEDANLRFDLGAGNLIFGPTGKDVALLDEATIRLHWDPASKAMILEPSTFFFGDTRGSVSGRISRTPAGVYAFDFESLGTVLAPRDSTAPPLVADRIAVSGSLDLAARSLEFQNAVITTVAGSIAAAGSVGFDGPTPSLAMAASFSPMPLNALKQMWPPFVAGGARRWVVEHVEDGFLAAGRFEAAVPAGYLFNEDRPQVPEDAMRLDMRLENVAFTTIGDLPRVTEASGNAVLVGSTFGLDVEKGKIVAPSGKVVQLTAGAFAVSNTAPRFPDGQIELQLEGDVDALAEIADAAPLNALSKQKLSPDSFSGKGKATVSVKLPLRPELTPADIDWRVAVDATDFASSVPLEGRKVADGTINLVATPAELAVRGKATIDGVVAALDMVKPLADLDGDGTLEGGRRSVRVSLDEKARKRLGIGLDDILGGTVGVLVSDRQDGKGQHYDVDLKQARVSIAALGWSKGVGVPATLAFDLLPADGGHRLDNMKLEGDGFGLSGSAVLDQRFGLVGADLDHLSLRKGDDISIKLSRKSSGYSIVARGDSFDARGLVARYKQTGGGAEGAAPDLSLDAKIGRITGFSDTALDDAAVTLTAREGVVRKLSVEGQLPRGGISAIYEDGGEAAGVDVQVGDAGSLLRFVDLYPRLSGGRLTISGRRRAADAPFVGTFDVSNFSIIDEKAMDRLVEATVNSPQGAVKTGLNAANVPFSRMRLDYTKRGSTIVIDDAILKGPAVGATMSGTLDLARQRVSLSGTYLPAYGVNNLFGRVPILGLALGGGPEGGLFGVTFKVEGPMEQPRMMINPLSAITPGMFRKIFEFPTQ